MTNIALETMSLSDLKKLKKDVDKAINTYEERQKAELASELDAIAREKGFTLSELSATSRKRKTTAAPKYRHPENPSITWSGRGRRPKWIVEALDNGKSLDDLRI